ncbi:MAG TPA: hypothetical protein VGQ33_05775 [Vicinamibacteria bacterium]|nr:hypothetical protein [Vicinamibacteria bacterium]
MSQEKGGNGHGDASPGPILDTVRARRFELVDARGEVRAVLGTQADNGAPGFLISDREGRPRMALHVSPDDTPAFDLLDATGAPRVHVALGDDGAPVVTLFGSTENPAQALLTVTGEGAAHLRLTQADGRTRLFCSLQADGTPYLSLMDAEGRPKLSCALPGGNPALLMLDTEGRPRAVMSVTREDGPQFAVLSEEGALSWTSARPPVRPVES